MSPRGIPAEPRRPRAAPVERPRPAGDRNSPEGDPDFYAAVLSELLADSTLSRGSRILVVCGGDRDHEILSSLAFDQVTICNLDARLQHDGAERFAPYRWSYEDAEALSYEDASFDFVIVHSGLHHLRCPLKGLTEMYRVAARGLLGFEPNRSLFTALGVKLGFGQEYETSAVFHNDCEFGGVANSPVPNFVFRFSKADVVRAIQSYAPVARHRYRFWYATRIPGRLYRMKRRSLGILIELTRGLLVFLGKTLPLFANNVAFFVAKPDLPADLFPWLTVEDGAIVPDVGYLAQIYQSRESDCPGAGENEEA